MSKPISRVLKEGSEKPTLTAAAKRVAGKAAVYVAGAAIPFLLWLAYLYFCFLGIEDAAVKTTAGNAAAGYHAPAWLVTFAQSLFHQLPGGTPIAWFYLAMFFVLFVASLFLSPNANSLHRLYRDRLSKAFLFDPVTIEGRPAGSPSRTHISAPLNIPVADQLMKYENFELAPLDRFKLSKVSCAYTPYHVINTALNIQGSKYANRRGRNAEFFIFSPKFTGSSATKFVRTKESRKRSANSTWRPPWPYRERRRRRTWGQTASSR